MKLSTRTLLSVCTEFSNLGDSIADQLREVSQGAPVSEQNDNAMRLAADWLRRAINLLGQCVDTSELRALLRTIEDGDEDEEDEYEVDEDGCEPEIDEEEL